MQSSKERGTEPSCTSSMKACLRKNQKGNSPYKSKNTSTAFMRISLGGSLENVQRRNSQITCTWRFGADSIVFSCGVLGAAGGLEVMPAYSHVSDLLIQAWQDGQAPEHLTLRCLSRCQECISTYQPVIASTHRHILHARDARPGGPAPLEAMYRLDLRFTDQTGFLLARILARADCER